MRRLPALARALLATAMLTACNSNSAPGNDREAQIDPAPTPAPRMGAAEALSGIAVEAVQPETMTDADISAVGGLEGRCAIRLTEVSEPSSSTAQAGRPRSSSMAS